MGENSLVKYDRGEIERVGNSIAITNKLLSLKVSLSDLIIEKTATSPYINFNASTGNFKIEGRSVPVNSIEFYSPTISWLDKYFINPKNNVNFKFQLEYINGDSSTIIQSILNHTIKKANEKEIKCSIDWYFETDDDFILEFGKHLKDTLKVPFNLIPSGNSI